MILGILLLSSMLVSIETAADCVVSNQSDGSKHVNCKGKALNAIPNSTHFENAASLNLDDNFLGLLQPFAFQQWPSLAALSLANASLSAVDSKSFYSLDTLRRLNFRHNQLVLPHAISPVALPASLHYLDISFNPLGVIPDQQFYRLKDLQVLKLAYSKIRTVSPTAFIGLRSLRILYLYNNELVQLPEEYTMRALQAMPKLQQLLLGGKNRWNCDCDLRWLKIWHLENPQVKVTITLATDKGSVEVGPECWHPTHLRGRNIYSSKLPIASFQCPMVRKSANFQMSSQITLFIGIAAAWSIALCAIVGAICLWIGQRVGLREHSLSTTVPPDLGSNLPQLQACVTAMEEEALRKKEPESPKQAKDDIPSNGDGTTVAISYV